MKNSLIRVEFFGVPRLRAGVAETVIELPQGTLPFADLLAQLAQQFPSLSRECFAEGTIRAGYSANVDGRRFISRPDDRVEAGETVLLFSADAGG